MSLQIRRRWPITLLALAALASASGARAVEIEKLVMPGPVIAGHARFEADCRRCHAAFAKTRQNALCLDCHDKVAADLRAATGFHGRSGNVGRADCATCHADHLGRDADIVRLDRDTFDHRWTDFQLRGAHQAAACAGCHEPGARYRDAPTGCVACHREDDAHRGGLGDKCATCHTEQAWRAAATVFDHAESTGYPLLGGHARVVCEACHANQRYASTPTRCIDCHRDDDPHAGRNGEGCGDCHGVGDWRRPTFDHGRKTGFALRGRHAQVACASCHTGGDLHAGLPTDCYGCHQGDDAHQGLNGRACGDCHGNERWSESRFDHDRATRFPLLGAHRDVTCRGCHTAPATEARPETACIACHARDDAHGGKLGRACDDCHKPTGWRRDIAFDHDLTAFPLNGLHAVVPCEGCHVTTDFRGTASACRDCHADDDAHAGRLGSDCARCHNPNDWNLWVFDHGRQTDFALDGAHSGLKCEACHARPVKGPVALASDCAGCHRNDDVHKGGFGTACERCHTTASFANPRRPARP